MGLKKQHESSEAENKTFLMIQLPDCVFGQEWNLLRLLRIDAVPRMSQGLKGVWKSSDCLTTR